MTVNATILTAAEQDLLASCEARIERGMKTFIEVGTDLATIRNNRLYRETHDTFEAYAADRLAISRPRAYELMAAAAAVSGIPDTLPVPANAGQALELARLPEGERAVVWAAALDATDGRPTAAAIRGQIRMRETAQHDDVPAGPKHEIPHQVPVVAATDRPDDTVPSDPGDAEDQAGEAPWSSTTPAQAGVPPQEPAAASRPPAAAGGASHGRDSKAPRRSQGWLPPETQEDRDSVLRQDVYDWLEAFYDGAKRLDAAQVAEVANETLAECVEAMYRRVDQWANEFFASRRRGSMKAVV